MAMNERDDQAAIESVLAEDERIEPPPHLLLQATLQDPDAAYERSIADPETFWADIASDFEWYAPWTAVHSREYPQFRWFEGAKVNITANALDRHARGPRANKVAYIALGEDGSERIVTYRQLLRLVNRFTNVLRESDVRCWAIGSSSICRCRWRASSRCSPARGLGRSTPSYMPGSGRARCETVSSTPMLASSSPATLVTAEASQSS